MTAADITEIVWTAVSGVVLLMVVWWALFYD